MSKCKTVTLRKRKIKNGTIPPGQKKGENENNGFFDKTKMKGDFLAYFKGLADRKNIKWQHVYKHFQRFVNGKCTFEEVDVDLCRKFMEYLLDAPQSIHTNQKLHINSAAGYWSTFRAVLHTAYRDRKIKENPNGFFRPHRVHSHHQGAFEPRGTDTACRNTL